MVRKRMNLEELENKFKEYYKKNISNYQKQVNIKDVN